MSKYVFGEIPGYPVGSTFLDRKAAMYAGLHVNWVRGISGNRHEGCDAICLNGGYDTDEDYGQEIFYTGSGGQDQATKKAARDQDLADSDNAALVMSQQTGLPIRILRGPKGDPAQSPSSGYRYDGLYKVVKHYPYFPADGLRRWMFHLVQLTAEEAAAFTPDENKEANAGAYGQLATSSDPFVADEPVDVVLPAGNATPGQKIVIQQRIIRDTKVSVAVKAMYDGTCQVCNVPLSTKQGNYSEGAHIRPLGKPHHGPDTADNILCLCPNHHALFDKGGLYFDDDMNAFDHAGMSLGTANVLPHHGIDLNYIRYHRSHHGFDA